MLFPFRIETLLKDYPWANWAIMALTTLVFFLSVGGVFSEDLISRLILEGWNPVGMVGYTLLHSGILHLAGNMLCLWVFGNAVCGCSSNLFYPLLYWGFGVAAAIPHVLLDCGPAVGASGAINGVVGMALAMYPLNRVSVFWYFFLRFGTFQIPLWGLATIWLAFDFWGVLTGGGDVAYWAHLGGFFAGLATGYLFLRKGWVELTEFDNRSLEEIFSGKSLDARRARIREAEAGVVPARAAGAGGPWAQQSAAAGDPLVMPATGAMVRAWSRLASGTEVTAADAAVIEAGGPDGERRRFELLYGVSFATMGYSFHRSLADYFRRVAKEQVWPHEGPALADLLRMVEEDFAAMRACGFVDDDVAWLRDEGRLALFLRQAPGVKA